MKKILIRTFAATLCAAAIASYAQPVALSGTSYFQDFNDLGGGGLAGEWTIYTGATATSLGTVATLLNAGDPANAASAWKASNGGFKNFASTNNTAGSAFDGTEAIAAQAATTDRVLGIRQTGTLGDPGAAFVLKVADTHGWGSFKLDVDFFNFDPTSPRSTYWRVDFGVSPDGFSDPTSFTTITTNAFLSGGSADFASQHKTIDFGSALDNQPGPIWIRIVTLNASTGSGNRPSTGIDNFHLTYTPVDTTVIPVSITTGMGTNTAFVGNNATLSVAVAGTAPFTYQWYFGDLNTPISGETSASYSQFLTSPDQGGTYYVIVSNDNGANSVTNVGELNVILPTPIVTNIAYLRTLQNENWAPSDTTNLYTVRGTVITRVNMTTPANASFWIEDTNSLVGINVFVGGSTDIRPSAGDVVEVTGPLGSFNGVLELNLSASNPTHIVTTLSSGNPLPPAKAFDFASQSNIPLMETNIEGSLVIVPAVYLPTGTSGTFTSGQTLTITNLSGQTFLLYIDARLTDIIGQDIPTGLTSITGYMTQFDSSSPYTSGYEIVPTRYEDIVPASVGPTPEPLVISVEGSDVVLSWTNPLFNLQAASAVTGTYTNVPGATSPYHYPLTEGQKYFRLSYP